MNKVSEEIHHKDPQFGHHLGLLYPLTWRILATHRYWSPSMWLPKDSALAIDIYIGIWWLIEILCIVFSGCLLSLAKYFGLLLVLIPLFRLVDLMFVLLSILVKGNYRRQGDWPSVNRVILLVIFNALEIMVLFALIFYALSVLTPNIASTNPELKTFFEALYFSFVTGTSLGYGIPHPVGWLARLLSISEASYIILVVIAVISSITSEKKKSQH